MENFMYLSKFTDYSFRILIYLGNHPNQLFTVYELSNILNLSTNHIKKITYNLVKNGYIVSNKGRNGGIKLIKSPEEINLCDVFETTEENLNLVECFSNMECGLIKPCKLKPIFNESLNLFKLNLSKYTLKDIL